MLQIIFIFRRHYVVVSFVDRRLTGPTDLTVENPHRTAKVFASMATNTAPTKRESNEATSRMMKQSGQSEARQ